MMCRLDILGGERASRRDDLGRYLAVPQKGLRRSQPRTSDSAVVAPELDWNEPRLFFKEQRITDLSTIDPAARPQRKGAADIRMPRKPKLGLGREDADFGRMARVLGRQHECRFR